MVLSVVSFFAGRFFERRANQITATNDASPRTPNLAEKRVNGNSSQDDKKCQEIADLNGQVSEMNWELVTPFKEFEAGKIDAATFRQRTAEPEVQILRLCTRMYKLANEVESTETRNKAVNFTAAVLLRQRGFSMMIEGVSLEDDSRITEGARLFEDGRNKALAAVVAFAGSDNPQAAHLKRLMDAYEPRENSP
jgi:hypothetical protein